jgi:large subunit ribosomal protein L35
VKASAKRFRVTGRGKIVRRCAGKQHLLGKKNTKRKKRLSKMVCFCSSSLMQTKFCSGA